MRSKRNGEIDLLRFALSIIIVVYHFHLNYNLGIFTNGFIGVEFFFLLSGFLMAGHVSRIRNRPQTPEEIASATWTFTINKVKSFYKYFIAVMLLNLVVGKIIVQNTDLITAFKDLLRSIPTFTLTFMGLNRSTTSLYVGNTWYLSAMIIAQFILYPMLLKSFDFSTKITFPLAALFLLGYINYTFDTIIKWEEWTGFCYVGILRAIAELALGAALFQLTEALRRKWAEKSFDDWIPAKIFLTAVKIACYLVVFIYAYGVTIGRNGVLHVMLFCAGGIVLSLSNLGYTIPDGKLTRYLGKLSLPIFIFHGFLRHTCKTLTGDAVISARESIPLILAAVVLSVILMYVTDFCSEQIKKLFSKVIPHA